MKICELPRLKAALDQMGLDNGANVHANATLPQDWVMRGQLAEDELLHLSGEQVIALAMGEESEMAAVAALAPNANSILEAAFDGGDLAEIIFAPWRNIFDARAAEKRING